MGTEAIKQEVSLTERQVRAFEKESKKTMDFATEIFGIMTEKEKVAVEDKTVEKYIPYIGRHFTMEDALFYIWRISDKAELKLLCRAYTWASTADFLEIALSSGKAPYKALMRQLADVNLNEIRRAIMNEGEGIAEKLIDSYLNRHINWELQPDDFSPAVDESVRETIRSYVRG